MTEYSHFHTDTRAVIQQQQQGESDPDWQKPRQQNMFFKEAAGVREANVDPTLPRKEEGGGG